MSILNHDLLILQQFRSDSSPRFDILDAQGQGVGVVSGTESGVRRIFLGAREFDVLDTDGSLLTHVSDVRDLWRDTYKVMCWRPSSGRWGSSPANSPSLSRPGRSSR